MKKTLILLNSRLLKLFANLTKILCYAFHFLFPGKRFTLPRQAAPLLRSKKASAVTRILWQTNYTDRVTLPVYLNYLCNRLLSPSFEYRFMITEERAEFIQANFPPDIYENYCKLQIGAAQADFWRVLVLQKYGGVYMDIDAHLVWPLGWLIKADTDELYIKMKSGELSNFFIASRKDNPNMEKISAAILNNIQHSESKNVYDITGPGVFNRLLNQNDIDTTYYRYTCNQGNFTNEYFQYIDKPEGKWTKAQEKVDVVRK